MVSLRTPAFSIVILLAIVAPYPNNVSITAAKRAIRMVRQLGTSNSPKDYKFL